MEVRDFEALTPDGRRLCARTVGPADGTVVIFHTGTPGTRYLFEGFFEDCAERDLRLVCYSRPGYDGSDRLPGRRFVDSAVDTAAVADWLGAEAFYVIGHSGGGPPALADAAVHSGRVLAAAVLSSMAPREADGDGLDWFADTDAINGPEFRALKEDDAALERVLREAAEGFREVETGEQLRDAFKGSLSEADLNSLVGRFLQYQVESCPLAVRGDIWGWFDDDKALWEPWGFDLARISVPVTVWQGGADTVVPAAHGKWLADRIPGARFHPLHGEGHFSYTRDGFGAILDELIAL